MLSELADQVIEAVKGYVSKSEERLLARVAELEDFIKKLPAPERGEKGEPGKPGDKGEPGESIKGDKGDPGESIKGLDGEDGVDGRDALDLDVMRGINPEKRYSKGSYATHNGGLWLSRKNTDGMDGWECIVDGVAEMSAELAEDGRTIQLRSVMASGTLVEKEFSVPTMVYRDLFKEGQLYQKGDTVTWAGHMWYCKRPTDSKPQEGEDWRIAVKRGQDGKS